MLPKDIRKELIRGIVGVARDKEFYGHVIQQFEKVFVGKGHTVTTAAVGKQKDERFIKLYLNEPFFTEVWDATTESIPNKLQAGAMAAQKVSGVIEHEVLHVVLGHLLLELPDKTRRAIAVDCVVNPLISEERRLDIGVMPEQYGFPRGQTAVWYYNNLKGNAKYNQDCQEGKYGPQGTMDWVLSSHELWNGVSKDVVLKELIKDIIRKAKEVTSAEGWGNVPSEVVESIADLLKVKPAVIPWQRALRMFCASMTDDFLEYTQKRESRRFGVRPGTRKGDKLNLAVALDTSGSVCNEQLASFLNEVRWIWRNNADVTVIESDAKVARSYRFNGKFDGTVHGRGGTNLEPALLLAEQGHFDGLIYCTDFQAPAISRKYRIPVLWLLTNPLNQSAWPCTWGRVAIMKQAA